MTEFPNALLTTRQVARILKVNQNRVSEYANSGKLPYVYTPDTLRKWETGEQVPMSIERVVGLAELYSSPELIELRIVEAKIAIKKLL